MDHRYIDQFAVAERYLNHRLPPEERADFEAHFADCQECIDRLLLAEMFHARNGFATVKPSPAPRPAPLPFQARLAMQLKPWQWLAIFIAAAILLLALPTLLLSLKQLGPFSLRR